MFSNLVSTFNFLKKQCCLGCVGYGAFRVQFRAYYLHLVFRQLPLCQQYHYQF